MTRRTVIEVTIDIQHPIKRGVLRQTVFPGFEGSRIWRPPADCTVRIVSRLFTLEFERSLSDHWLGRRGWVEGGWEFEGTWIVLCILKRD